MAAAGEPPTVTPTHRGGELPCCRLSFGPHSTDFSLPTPCLARRQSRRKCKLVYDGTVAVNTENRTTFKPFGSLGSAHEGDSGRCSAGDEAPG